MKRIISALLILCILLCVPITIIAESGINYAAEWQTTYSDSPKLDLGHEVGGAYLCEASTGQMLYAENDLVAASPASVTKVMTLLLVCEALDAGRFKLDDMVRVSARAASMGGSQVFLEEGERISVEDLIKSAVIASGNDASVALAELTAGSEGEFVKLMNRRAAELGLKNTSFENTTGLDDDTVNHYSCAYDIAVMSRELIKHPIILQYSSIWQDSIRNGEFTLTNTNRLVRYYDGCNGLKTGSTDKARYCVTVTAKRGNMQLIAVVMGAKTKEERNAVASRLLDFGFASYGLYEADEQMVESVRVTKGYLDSVALYSTPFSAVIDKGGLSAVEKKYDIPESISAPVSEGEIVGSVVYILDGVEIGKSDIYASCSIEKIKFTDLLGRILKRIICG